MPYELKGKPRAYFKWVDKEQEDKEIGTSFRGIFIENGEDVYTRKRSDGTEEKKPTFHAIFNDEHGVRTQVSCPAVLKGLLEEAERGMDLTITFVGYLKKKAGQSPAKDFKVVCNNREAPDATVSDRQEPEPPEDDVPF
jgi:hypothetical protein